MQINQGESQQNTTGISNIPKGMYTKKGKKPNSEQSKPRYN